MTCMYGISQHISMWVYITQLFQVSLTLCLLGVKKELGEVDFATLHGVNGRMM